MLRAFAMAKCFPEPLPPWTNNTVLLQTVAVTIVVTCGFLISKSTYDNFRRRWARATVVVIGAGPIGLMSVLIAARSGKVERILLYEEKHRCDLLNRPQQIAIDSKSVSFLQALGVDFDNIEGCWQHCCFFTKIGVFQEYMLSIIYRLQVKVEVKLHYKFTRDSLKELDALEGRLIVVVCDGTHGRSASLLGLSDEFTHQSCKTYGTVAAIEKPDQRSIPAPEIRIHNLTFDLNAYGNDWAVDSNPQGFHLKIFGTMRHRYMCLAVPKCESKLVRTLKVMLDQSVMRNIFQVCFNNYKTETESYISDKAALKYMKFSPRLFEIKLSQRMETVAFIQDANLFVVAEGEAARSSNFHTGMDVNLAIRGLASLEHFIRLASMAETEKNIIQALMYKFNHAKAVTLEFVRSGIRENVFS